MAQVASGTMDDFHRAKPSWASEVQSYERSKRQVVDAGLVRGPPHHVTASEMKLQERMFDPLLQRFRDNGTEYQSRLSEETARVRHLNRAADTQILREQPFNVVTHESRLEAIAPGKDPTKIHRKGKDQGVSAYPTSFVDYHIISNMPHQDHHWAKPEDRPTKCQSRHGTQRKVPQMLVKDFDIVTNRYKDDHSEKAGRDRHLNLLEATSKYNTRNRFDPVTQTFNDPTIDERMHVTEMIRQTEAEYLANALVPPAYKGRVSNFYNITSHAKHDPQMLKAHDQAEDERASRFKNRYILEHNRHAQDLRGEHICEARKLNKVAHERWQEQEKRGFDIVNNTEYGPGHKRQLNPKPYAKEKLSTWDQVQAGRDHYEANLPPRAASTPPGMMAPGTGSDETRSRRSERRRKTQPAESQRSAPAPPPMPQGGGSGAPRPPYTMSETGSLPSRAPSVASHSSMRRSPTPGDYGRLTPSLSAGATIMPPGRTAPPRQSPPPAPAIPGSDYGSVYSRARS